MKGVLTRNGWQLEKSEVSFAGRVAVAVMNWFSGVPTPKTAITLPVPPGSVVSMAVPTNAWPSPNPDGSQTLFRNTSMLKVVLGVLLKLSQTLVVPPVEVQRVTVGAAWLLLPPLIRAIPKPSLE